MPVNIWVQIGIMIVSALISYALRPKPEAQPPAALEDFQAPTAEEGRPIPVIFGEVLVESPNVVWFGHLKSVARYASGK